MKQEGQRPFLTPLSPITAFNMKQIATLFDIQIKPKARSEKQEVIENIYEVYSNVSQSKFRDLKNKKKIDLKKFAIFLSKNPTQYLYEILSISKDKDRRGEDAGGYIAANFVIFR